MANYLFTYHGGSSPETEEQGEQVMAAWGAWLGSLGEAVVDQGNPVGPSATVAADGTTGSFDSADTVTGYSVVTASDLDTATAMAKGCPIREAGGWVEIGEIVTM